MPQHGPMTGLTLTMFSSRQARAAQAPPLLLAKPSSTVRAAVRRAALGVCPSSATLQAYLTLNCSRYRQGLRATSQRQYTRLLELGTVVGIQPQTISSVHSPPAPAGGPTVTGVQRARTIWLILAATTVAMVVTTTPTIPTTPTTPTPAPTPTKTRATTTTATC